MRNTETSRGIIMHTARFVTCTCHAFLQLFITAKVKKNCRWRNAECQELSIRKGFTSVKDWANLHLATWAWWHGIMIMLDINSLAGCTIPVCYMIVCSFIRLSIVWWELLGKQGEKCGQCLGNLSIKCHILKYIVRLSKRIIACTCLLSSYI